MTPDAEVRRTSLARSGDLAVFAANGFSFASWMSRIPDIRDALDLTPGLLGVLLLSLSAGALIGLPAAGPLAHRIGAKRAVRVGLSLAIPGLVWAAIAAEMHGTLFWVLPGLFLLGFGNGIWDVAQNLQGTVIEQALGRSIMPWFHAAFSAGTVAGALVGAGMTAWRVPLWAHLGVVAVAAVVALLWGTARFLPSLESGAASAPEAQGKGPDAAGVRPAWFEPRTLMIGVMVLAASFTEGTANDWLAVAFVDGHGLDKALGVVALATFLSFMTAGRIVGTRVLDRFGRLPVLTVLFLMSLVGCLLVVFGDTAVAFVGVAIWGLASSLGFPVGMSAAADDPARAPARISVVSTIGYTAFLAGPPLLGLLGDRVGVLRALLAVGAASVLALMALPAARPLPASGLGSETAPGSDRRPDARAAE